MPVVMLKDENGVVLTPEEYKKVRDRQKEALKMKQSAPYSVKVAMAKDRIRDFVETAYTRGYSTYVSVGGLDSITLAALIRSMGVGYQADDIPLVSCSCLEDKSIQKVHDEIGVIKVKPLKSKVQVLQEYGFPVLSKKTANLIDILQHPDTSEHRKEYVHNIVCRNFNWSFNSLSNLTLKWLKLFGGTTEEGRALGYKCADFKVSAECCKWLKEKPVKQWAKEHKSVPFLGLMASEGGRREKALETYGCNYWGLHSQRSCPFSFFYHSDVVHLAVDLGVHIPEIYGNVVITKDSETGEDIYSTDGEYRTGCSMCGFGIQMEKRPHNFDRLYERNPKEWEFWMYNCVKDENGEKYGWGKVLDYIGIEWRDPEHWWLDTNQ